MGVLREGGGGRGYVRYARNLGTRLQDVFVHRSCIKYEGYSFPGRDEDCTSGTTVPVVEVAEQLEGRVVMGIVREVEKDVVGLDETRHRLELTGRMGGMARGRKMEEMMVDGRREREANTEERRLQFCYPDLMWNGDRTMTRLLILPPEIRLIIFKFFLHLALNSQHNEHLKLLQTCTQVAAEAGPIVRQYLCLKDEAQIRGLLFDAHRDHLAQVCAADVATDSRLIRYNETSEVRIMV